jgi:hypothetical protein
VKKRLPAWDKPFEARKGDSLMLTAKQAKDVADEFTRQHPEIAARFRAGEMFTSDVQKMEKVAEALGLELITIEEDAISGRR